LEQYVRPKDSYTIFYDSLHEGEWIRSLHPHFSKASLIPIIDPGNNIPSIDQLIAYDRPDVIISYEGRPFLVIERTEEVPSSHNCGQRFARIVRASELGVPVIYFFPFVAQKHGAESRERQRFGKANQRYVNPRLFSAFERIEEIHDTLIIPISWPVDSEYELLRTPEKDVEIKCVLHEIVKWLECRKDLTKLGVQPNIVESKAKASREKDTRYRSTKKNRGPPPSVRIERTSAIVEEYRINEPVTTKLLKRDRSVVYRMGMRYLRSDPYAGTLALYDYLYARTGPNNRSLHECVVTHAPNIDSNDWNRIRETGSQRKDVSLFRLFSDCIILGDVAVI